MRTPIVLNQPLDSSAHLPVLDGVRGLAIVMVMLHHMTDMSVRTGLDQAFHFSMRLGAYGVDLFFVLSGFLITGILLDTKGEGPGPYFRNFYARRVLRIFPLYYAIAVIALVILPHFHHAKAENFSRLEGREIWYWFFLGNFAKASAGRSLHAIMDPTWSLCIEEQFYLVWPLVVLMLPRRGLAWLCGAVIAAALVIRTVLYFGYGATPTAIWVWPHTRMDSLAVGALIAVLARGPAGIGALRAWTRLGVWAGLLAVALLAWDMAAGRSPDGPGTGPLGMTVGLSLVAVCFGSLLVWAACAAEGSGMGRFFGSRAMRMFGVLSYSLYLLHIPLRAVIRDAVYGPNGERFHPRVRFPVIGGSELVGQVLFYVPAFALCLVGAGVTYLCFEKQFLKLKRFFVYGRRNRGVPAGLAGLRPVVDETAAEGAAR